MDKRLEELMVHLVQKGKAGELDYYTNEEPEAFLIRNQHAISQFDADMPWEVRLQAAVAVLKVIPERYRERNTSSSQQPPRKPISRQTDMSFAFTIVLDETKVGHEIYLQPLQDPDKEPVIIPIDSHIGHALKQAFTEVYDKEARQSQFKA
jgi:hypothetical protein